MAKTLTAADVEGAVRALISAENTNLGIEVTVPVAYGDGELVSVVVEQNNAGLTVHDAGFSGMRLSGAGISLSRNVVHRLSEFAQRYRCQFVEGRVSSSATPDDVALVVSLVANASRSVADYVYEIRRQVETDFRVVVFDKLREIVGDRARETEEFRGKSGRLYRVPIVLDASMTRPQNFVSTLANRQAVPLSFAMLYDLGQAYPDIERDAVYDDDAGLRQEDRSFIASTDAQVFGWMEAERRFRGFIHNVKRH
jgi:hypothetical protein